MAGFDKWSARQMLAHSPDRYYLIFNAADKDCGLICLKILSGKLRRTKNNSGK